MSKETPEGRKPELQAVAQRARKTLFAMAYRCGHPRGGCPKHCDILWPIIHELEAALSAQQPAPACNGPFGDEEACPVHGEEICRARGKLGPAPAEGTVTRTPREWIEFCEQHLAAPDEDGCSCELHRILNEKVRLAERGTVTGGVGQLREALEVIAEALKEPAGGEYWPARKFLDKHGIYHENLEGVRVLNEVARAALRSPVVSTAETGQDALRETLQSIADFAVGHGDVCEIIAKRARVALRSTKPARQEKGREHVHTDC